VAGVHQPMEHEVDPFLVNLVTASFLEAGGVQHYPASDATIGNVSISIKMSINGPSTWLSSSF
jgi:hypothetical protein